MIKIEALHALLLRVLQVPRYILRDVFACFYPEYHHAQNKRETVSVTDSAPRSNCYLRHANMPFIKI